MYIYSLPGCKNFYVSPLKGSSFRSPAAGHMTPRTRQLVSLGDGFGVRFCWLFLCLFVVWFWPFSYLRLRVAPVCLSVCVCMYVCMYVVYLPCCGTSPMLYVCTPYIPQSEEKFKEINNWMKLTGTRMATTRVKSSKRLAFDQMDEPVAR